MSLIDHVFTDTFDAHTTSHDCCLPSQLAGIERSFAIKWTGDVGGHGERIGIPVSSECNSEKCSS